MNLRRAIALAIGGYLLGSVSFARFVGRRAGSGELVEGIDMVLPGGAEIEYRGVSATSVAVRSGPAWGIATGVLDAAKAFGPTLLAQRLWPDEPYHVVVATAVMVGHNYPLYHGFNGGRGQTPFYGSMLAIDPVSIPVTNAAGVLVGVGLFRELLAGYSLGMWFTIPWLLWRGRRPEALFAIVGNILFSVAILPEARAYLEKRRSGELGSISSWKEFFTSYPALASRRQSSPAP
jgi:glycerol-3-phosphate acyltransferase PlsY